MKVVILAGGFGTRFGNLTEFIPKPMIDIGGVPIIHHIMDHYSSYGYNDFVIALGYKAWNIKSYFLNYHKMINDVSIDFNSGNIIIHKKETKNWNVSLVDTGLNTMTGGRLKRLSKYLDKDTFMLTYGDGLSNVDISKLVDFHKKQKKIGTVTAVRPVARFGEITIKDDLVNSFKEKPQGQAGWINGGFFVFEPEFLDLIEGDMSILEAEPLEKLTSKKELNSFKHYGFWQCMDTKRDYDYLLKMWDERKPEWKTNSKV